MIIIEYVWVDGSGTLLRSKTRTVDKVENQISDVPIWNYDGSSTGQAARKSSEVELVPVALFRDPFRRNEKQTSFIALCKTRSARDHKATEKGDRRHVAERIFNNPTLENKLHKLFNLCNPALPLLKKWKRGQVPTPEGS